MTGATSDSSGCNQVSMLFPWAETVLLHVCRLAYYPGTADEGRIIPLRVRGGEDIILRPIVVHPRQQGAVQVRLIGETLPERARPTVRVGAYGVLQVAPMKFTFESIMVHGIAIGRHHLMTTWQTGPTDLFYGDAIVDVAASKEPQVLPISIQKGIRIGATFAIQDDVGRLTSTSPTSCVLRSVRFPTLSAPCPGPVVPGEFTLELTNMPVDHYLVSASVGDEDFMNGPIKLVKDSNVDVVLSAPGAIIEGRVTDLSGTKLSDAIVALLPEPPFSVGLNYRFASTDINGRFELRGIKPGKYMLYAWPELEGPAYLSSAYMVRFRDRGQSLSISPRERRSVNMTAFER